MKIAIPVEDKDALKVCISFGRTPYFYLYDTGTKLGELLDNQAASSQGGAGIKAAQEIADNDVNALITPRCGQNAADVFHAANIALYQTINASVEDNINAFNNGELTLLNDIHAGFHNHGGSST